MFWTDFTFRQQEIFFWQPEISGWIQAAMQQNTIILNTIFPHIIAAATILFWNFQTLKISNTVFPHIVSSLEYFPPLNSFLSSVRKLFKFLLHKEKNNEEAIWNFQGLKILKKNSAEAIIWGNTENLFSHFKGMRGEKTQIFGT